MSMNYLLVVFGDYTHKTDLVKIMAETIATISDDEDVRYTYGDSTAVISFKSIDDQEEVALFVGEILKDISTLYLLTPYSDNVFTSLPLDIHKYLFGISDSSETLHEDSYNLDEEIDIEEFSPKKDVKITKKSPKPEIKSLTLDEILDKINEKGITSLTEQERSTLKKYSN